MRVAIIGCGFIADHYARSLQSYPSLQLVGVTDQLLDRAMRFGSFFGARVHRTTSELLADPSVEIVLNLTNPRSHCEVSERCLRAGKHVYSEKPLAMCFEDARALVELAESRGLQLSSAPCNILGECIQTMWRAVRERHVGMVRVVYAEMDDGLVHRMQYRDWLSESGTPWPYMDEFAVGCTIEHAGYSLSPLAALFGPATSVTAFASVQIPDKGVGLAPKDMGPDLSIAAIQFASGVVARLTCSIIAPIDHSFRVIGDAGILYTPDVWHFDAPVYKRHWVTIRRRTLLNPIRHRLPRLKEAGRKLAHDDRGRGVAEMAASIMEKRPNRLPARFALHVTELALAIQQAQASSCTCKLTSTFDPIEPMPWAS